MDELEKWNDKLFCQKTVGNIHTLTAADVDTRNNRWQVNKWMCVHCCQYVSTTEIQNANTANHAEMYFKSAVVE